MKVCVTGSSGLIGRALCPLLAQQGWTITRLSTTASKPEAGIFAWNPEQGSLESAALADVDAIVHLAGASIDQRWSEQNKRKILLSRVAGTSLICTNAAALGRPVAVISASAVGYYGDRGDKELVETDGPGEGFLANVCEQWEAACEPAEAAGLRVVKLRIAMVLSSSGGALPKIALPFRVGLGARIGDGTQFMSWIALDDLVRAIAWCLAEKTLAGPINACAPQAVANAAFSQALAGVCGKKLRWTVPKQAVVLMLGQKGKELLLVSQRCQPRRLIECGFQFNSPDLNLALQRLFGPGCSARNSANKEGF